MGDKDKQGLDLDAIREERLKGKKRPPALLFAGQKFKLPIEPPYMWWRAIVDKDYHEAIRQVLGEDQAQRFFGAEPAVGDVAAFIDQVSAVYAAAEPDESVDVPVDVTSKVKAD